MGVVAVAVRRCGCATGDETPTGHSSVLRHVQQ